MKKIGFYFCALVALALFSCEKAPVNPLDTLPENVAEFVTRNYPNASIVSVQGGKDDEYMRITLNDEIGNEYKVSFKDGKWMLTEKRYAFNEPMHVLPPYALVTYLKMGIGHEMFTEDCYIAEIDRKDMYWNQYEICCYAPYVMDDGTIDPQLQYHIVIAEDGTLLACSHDRFNPASWTVDLRPAIDIIYEKYGMKQIMGIVDEGAIMNRVKIFVDDRNTMKTVVFNGLRNENDVEGYEWDYTEWALPLDTTLPDYVQEAVDFYKSRHSDVELTGLFMVEHVNGFSYRFTFGPELHQDTWAIDINND